MLATLRKSSKSIVIKILMVILLFTFVLWGVGDMLRSGHGSYVLKVGDYKVNEVEFNNLYREQLAVIQQQFGHEFTKEELNDPQLKKAVINQVINRLLQRQLAYDMDFVVSDDMVKFEIASMPMFLKDGKFDKERFDAYLRNIGLNETKFVELLKEDLSSQNLSLLLSVLRFEPNLLTDTLLKARSQTYVLNTLTLPKSSITISEQPTEEELKSIFEANKAKFTMPETRDIAYIAFGSEAAKIDNVIDEELKVVYEGKKQVFTDPEKRKVQQMVFKDKAAGEQAVKDLDNGMRFEEVAKKNFPDKKSFVIGELTKNGLSADIANVIFTLPIGTPSKLVQSPMGYHIFLVDAVTEAKIKGFAEVKDKLRTSYLDEKRYEKLNEIAHTIDKEVLAGKNLDEIAKNFGFKVQELKSLSNTDNKDMMKIASFKSAIFSTDQGSVSMVTPLEGHDKYFLLAVNKIYPTKLKDMSEVKADVMKIWLDGKTQDRLIDISQDVYKALASGTKPEEVTKKFSLNAPKLMNISLMSDSAKKMSYEFLKEMLTLKTGSCTHPIKDEKGDYMIACLSGVIDADPAQLKDRRNAISMELMQNAPNELMVQLIKAAKEKYKVEFNNKYLEELEF
jgi:peptidyl-prolyl cis-trans isomerase D